MSTETTQDRDALLREGLRLLLDEVQNYMTFEVWSHRARVLTAVADLVRERLEEPAAPAGTVTKRAYVAQADRRQG